MEAESAIPNHNRRFLHPAEEIIDDYLQLLLLGVSLHWFLEEWICQHAIPCRSCQVCTTTVFKLKPDVVFHWTILLWKKKKKSCRFCCHIFLCNLTFQVSQLICSQLYSGLLRCIKLLMVINEKIITPNSTSHVLLYYYLNLDCTVEADDLWNTGRFQWETSVHYPFLSPRIQLDIQHWAAK